MEMTMHLEFWRNTLVSVGIIAGAVVVALAAHGIIFASAAKIAQRTETDLDDTFVKHAVRPARWVLPLAATLFALPFAPVPEIIIENVRHVIGLGLIAGIGWFLSAMLEVIDDVITGRYAALEPNATSTRQIRTQIRVLRRIAQIVVVVVTASIMLMTFPSIRTLGVSLFASAGVAGIVVGMAARPTISNLMAGVQIALAAPIRIDDAVVVEGEWGWVEEITTTYVVMRTWDLRRLIVPLSHFIEKPFQNWTRTSADLLGTVIVYADYSVPVELVRQELRHIVEESGLWDGKVCALHVTDATERAMQLRALVSASDAGKSWDLRCHVRERLIAFLQLQCNDSLPRNRTELIQKEGLAWQQANFAGTRQTAAQNSSQSQ